MWLAEIQQTYRNDKQTNKTHQLHNKGIRTKLSYLCADTIHYNYSFTDKNQKQEEVNLCTFTVL